MTTQTTFLINDIFKKSWGIYKKDAWGFILFVVIILILEIAGIPVSLLSIIVTPLLIKYTLLAINNEKPSFKQTIKEVDARIILYYIIASLIFGLINMIGTILLIIPGIIALTTFYFYSFGIIDKRMGPIESLKYSQKITKGHRWKIFVFGLVCILLLILGAIPIGLGLLITFPLTTIASALVYKYLVTKHSENSNVVNATA
ncbi:hypothetical protein A2997_01440 [Candidatus Nomurabacteria bacterium RIFCSPLOWO2_01_FULL_36_10b]|uniref:Glycerophosphoryl diester phosphodiesterase membrane domain-containing protein n=1 Tax=Candidatus Nomurabacteria bacterium RIFCSPLOWO2_01_FULL_36_10b TaxID=1801766 RepID=A0A1F6WNQ8_9BACT|nr:MAG: hypothetical protein A2997_01440 [Candidatus Nomurabacteria bacterium RIFCSPLOWO2_01_FULL_36_10b]